MRIVFKKVSSRPTVLFRRFCWNDSACGLPAATTTQMFSHSLFSHILCCSFLETLSTTNNLCIFWHSNFQRVTTYTFCSCDDTLTQKWNCSSANNLCKCTESQSTLSTNTSIEWNLFLSWSNHLVTSFRIETNVGGFSEHQNKTSDSERYKKKTFFHRLCLSSQCEHYENNFCAAVWIAGC